MSRAAAFRGQPLLLVAGLLAAWFGLRAALWQSPFPAPPQLPPPLTEVRKPPLESWPAGLEDAEAAGQRPWVARRGRREAGPWRRRRPGGNAPEAIAYPSFAAAGPVRVRAVVGHNLLFAAGLSRIELPPAVLDYLDRPPPPPGVPAAAPMAGPAPRTQSRWSGDGWLLWRRGGAAAPASDRPTYGRSQAGAVVRYAFARASAHRPQAYLRASSALSAPRERELAAGLSARPLAALPLRLALEARASETAAGTELRPAVYAVSELPPLALPGHARGEGYLQAGYVGGRFATAFVDGQGRIERPLARWGEAELAAGAGAWGGAQKGSARLDAGPTVAVTFRVGEARGRVAADYRFRLAGAAEPAGGPALTVSAGF